MCMLACVLMRCKSVVVRVSLVLLGEPSPCVTGAVLWRCAVHSLHDLVMAQVCRAWRDALRGGGVGCPSPLLAHMWDVFPVLEYLDMDSLHAVRMVCRRLRVLASPCLQGARDIMVLRYRDCRCTLPCLGSGGAGVITRLVHFHAQCQACVRLDVGPVRFHLAVLFDPMSLVVW